jgi:hypothetical protein
VVISKGSLPFIFQSITYYTIKRGESQGKYKENKFVFLKQIYEVSPAAKETVATASVAHLPLGSRTPKAAP